MSLNQSTPEALPERSRLSRWIMAAVGISSVGMGALGVFVPGLPTTIFLIIAVWCFSRSCPALERTLVRNAMFRPYLRYIDRTETIPTATKVKSIAIMWCFVAASAVIFITVTNLPVVAALVCLAACVGTVAILRWGCSNS